MNTSISIEGAIKNEGGRRLALFCSGLSTCRSGGIYADRVLGVDDDHSGVDWAGFADDSAVSGGG